MRGQKPFEYARFWCCAYLIIRIYPYTSSSEQICPWTDNDDDDVVLKNNNRAGIVPKYNYNCRVIWATIFTVQHAGGIAACTVMATLFSFFPPPSSQPIRIYPLLTYRLEVIDAVHLWRWTTSLDSTSRYKTDAAVPSKNSCVTVIVIAVDCVVSNLGNYNNAQINRIAFYFIFEIYIQR